MCMLGFSAHSFKYTHKFLVCVRMDYIWKDTKETTNSGYSREGRTGFSLCTLLYVSDFCHHGMCYLFKIRWIKKKKKEYEWPGRKGHFPDQCPQVRRSSGSGCSPQNWFSGRPGPPRCTCTALLTWAVVVRVSVHTFQEGHSRQGWLPSAAFGGCQTTAYRAGRERGAKWTISMSNTSTPALPSLLGAELQKPFKENGFSPSPKNSY